MSSKSIVSFRKWTRKNYAAFNSLKKVIKISSLIVGYNLVVQPISAQIEVDTIRIGQSVDLDEVVVESTRVPLIYSEVARIVNIITAEEIEHSPVNGVSDLLKTALSTDVRQRGISDIQSDISIRGGSYEQTLILLNGIMINDPQTGHHNMNLPVTLEDIEKIEILEGPGSRVFGPNAFSGAINIITKKANENYGEFGIKTGNNTGISANLATGFKLGKSNNYVSISRKKSLGYIENTDFDVSNYYLCTDINYKTQKINFQSGYSNKAFGANSFYTASFPDQYEKTKAFFAAAKYETGKRLKYSQSAYYRRHQDRFQLVRNNPEFYTNNHLTNVYGLNSNLNLTTAIGKTSVGIDYRSEQIRSNSLGESNDTVEVPGEEGWFFYKKGLRNYVNLYAEHFIEINAFTMSVGILNNISDDFSNTISPGIDLSYKISNALKLYSSYNHSMRVPTYTELYYKGYMQSGNLNLKPEKSETLEGGLKFKTAYLNSYFSVYNRVGKDIIDWVRKSDTLFWETKNLTTIQTTGFDVNILLSSNFFERINVSYIRNISVGYSFNDQKKNSSKYYSKYVMDFLKHKVRAGVTHELLNNIYMNWKIILQDREGTYTDFETGMEKKYEPFVIIDTKIFTRYNNLDVFFQVNNLSNISYFDFGNLNMPGRSFQLGISMVFNGN